MDYAIKTLEIEIARIRLDLLIARSKLVKDVSPELDKQVEELQLAIEILRKWEEYQDRKAIK